MVRLDKYIIEKLKINKETVESTDNYLLLVTQDDNAIDILCKHYGNIYHNILTNDYLFFIVPVNIAIKYARWSSIFIYHIWPRYEKISELMRDIKEDNLKFDELESY